jgi:DNA-binding Xre family transcriptional regulator
LLDGGRGNSAQTPGTSRYSCHSICLMSEKMIDDSGTFRTQCGVSRTDADETGEPMLLRSRRALGDYIDLLGVSEREVARSAGLSHSTVNHLVTGRRDSCSLRTAVAIERALHCPPGLLFAPDNDADRLALYRIWSESTPSPQRSKR